MALPKTKIKSKELFSDLGGKENLDSLATNLGLLTSSITKTGPQNNEELNQIELTSIFSMVAYVAESQGVSENTVATILTATFGAGDIKTLPAKRYQEMIEFLVDFQMNKILN